MFSSSDRNTAIADALQNAGFESNWLREVRKIIRTVAEKHGGDPASCLPGIWRKVSRHDDRDKMLRAVLEYYATKVVGAEMPFVAPPPLVTGEPVHVVDHTRSYPRGATVRTTVAVPGAGAPTALQKEAERQAEAARTDRFFMNVVPGHDLRDMTFGEIAQIVGHLPVLQRVLSFAANWTPNQRVRDVIKDDELKDIINGAA